MSREQWVGRGLLVALGVDGFVVGLLSVVFLGTHVGSVPVPLSAIVGGLVTGGLVYLAALYTAGPARWAPLVGWVIAVGIGLLGGPGGDVLTVGDWRVLVLIVCGAGFPALLTWTDRLPNPGSS
ncbi:hypothetical protein [Williamsia sterculiae]|uniref:Facilitated glucose transporter n=1 Tax=Williamsia sterculiae TaxID=1344003 RepID=A0A1N7FS20_9NOCA|nr:hypothetical protein [Williamsia sterculiae]SIS03067.1 hypothetical protein SAMN05445060_2231 [Williamsia sterculiae]